MAIYSLTNEIYIWNLRNQTNKNYSQNYNLSVDITMTTVI